MSQLSGVVPGNSYVNANRVASARPAPMRNSDKINVIPTKGKIKEVVTSGKGGFGDSQARRNSS